jgi:hypothetical protein
LDLKQKRTDSRERAITFKKVLPSPTALSFPIGSNLAGDLITIGRKRINFPPLELAPFGLGGSRAFPDSEGSTEPTEKK